MTLDELSALWVNVWPWLALLTLLSFWMLGAYNRLVALRAAILSAWSGVDQLVKTRSQVVLALLAAVADRLHGEEAALAAAGQAQSAVQQALAGVGLRLADASAVAALADADSALAGRLARLVALAEQQSALRADIGVAAQLQALRELEPQLGFARQRFNDAGARYNLALAQFPTRLLRPVFGFNLAGRF